MTCFRLLCIALGLILVAGGCTTPVPPQMRVFAPIDAEVEPLLYVTTTSERESVLAALRLAGFRVTNDLRATPLVLSVKLGSVRRTQPCGTVRNVAYDLRHAGVQIAGIKGRGWTGSCEPNILTDMSRELARLFGGQAGPR